MVLALCCAVCLLIYIILGFVCGDVFPFIGNTCSNFSSKDDGKKPTPATCKENEIKTADGKC